MSQQAPENFAQAFGNNFYELGQQRSSRFQPFVRMEAGIRGASKTVERLGEAALPSLALVAVGLVPVIFLSRTLRTR